MASDRLDSSKVLIAAEADQIQQTIFQASRLREVVGGSMLLDDFCAKLPESVKVKFPRVELIVSDGGSIRAKCPSDVAEQFAEFLANEYYLQTGNHLTIGRPFANYSEDRLFQQSYLQVFDGLRQQKATRGARRCSGGTPYSGMCVSCGKNPANMFRSLREFEASSASELEPPNYLCGACRQKADFRFQEESSFLKYFERQVCSDLDEHAGPQEKRTSCIRSTHDIEHLDRRRNVAYIKADGNGIGRWFLSCETTEQLRELSKSLRKAIWDSLADATTLLLNRAREMDEGFSKIPVLPLIVGGDDIFLLAPAKWSIDFAREVAKNFETGMTLVRQKLELNVDPPTISIAVVICKAGYPHQLAHQKASNLLDQTKRFGKTQTPMASALTFELVSGNALATGLTDIEDNYRSTMQPYPVTSTDDVHDVGTLFRAKAQVAKLPKRRLQELRMLFNDPPENPHHVDDWNERFSIVMNRTKAVLAARSTDGELLYEELERAIESLGGLQKQTVGERTILDPWKRIRRGGPDFFGSGFPDLLIAWNFLEKLTDEE